MKQMEARAREVWLVWLTSQVPMDGATGGDNVTESMGGGTLRGGWGQLEFLMKKKKKYKQTTRCEFYKRFASQ